MTQAEKLTDLIPPVNKVELAHGKVASIGLLSLMHLVEAEEKYGSAEAFIDKISNKPKAADILDMVWMLIENKEDFGDDKTTFAKHVPASVLMNGSLADALAKSIMASMPKKTPGGAEGSSGTETSNPTGETTSPPS
jgi:hypothetical protein